MDTCVTSESVRLPATPVAARWARQAIDVACQGLDADVLVLAKLLTTELVTNAVRHPVRDDPGRDVGILVCMIRTNLRLRIEVHDHDARSLPQARPPPELSEFGMGLYLVDQLASAWGADVFPTGDGKAVWFELQI